MAPAGRARGYGHRFLVCEVCNARVGVGKGMLQVECECGALYNALTHEPVKEPICGLPTNPGGSAL